MSARIVEAHKERYRIITNFERSFTNWTEWNRELSWNDHKISKLLGSLAFIFK
jgi:hypothetical protein